MRLNQYPALAGIITTAALSAMAGVAVAQGASAQSGAKAWAQSQFPGAVFLDVKDLPQTMSRTGVVLHHVKGVTSSGLVEATFDDVGNVLPDGGRALIQQENHARWLERGGMTDDLWNRLAQVPESATIPVAIWLRSDEPAANKVELEKSVFAGLFHMVARDMAHANAKAAFAGELAGVASAKVSEQPGAPVVVADLAPAVIRKIAKFKSVGWIDWRRDGKPSTGSTHWVDATLASSGSSGMSGSGEAVCVIEQYQPSTSITLTPANNRYHPNDLPADAHARLVMGSIRSEATPVGTGSVASIDLANYKVSDLTFAGAANWCASTRYDYVWNYSYECNDSLCPALIDYWVKQAPYPLVTLPSGNNSSTYSEQVKSKAFNAMIVGGSLDQDTSARTDDYMWTKSSHINLSTQYGPGGGYYTDWELPNIVAPARASESVCLNIDGYDACVQDYGTSFSTAQVAGIVAQIHQANNWLRTWPETVRSILMCSANRDLVVGRLNLKDSIDDRDGAGEANATLAVQMANVSNRVSPGSAATARGMDYTIVFQADHAENTSLAPYAAQTSASGKRLRAVLTWDASTTCTNVADPSTVACNASSLDADLDLWVLRHDNGKIMDYSNTYVGSYEFVEFAAEPGVQYDIKVKFSKWWNPSTYYAISWNFDDYTSAD